ncbi:MAG: UvrD-helicase domain-containing protein [Bacteroidetes bacterium]|nr:UvrD-helicase domain-containing protein [Bacteroidota bacterium]
MPQVINVTDEDIHYAESVLLPAGMYFNEERVDYIKCFDTVDLQAVPGSGKTTALLAKLLILEHKLPFEDGSGILVLSHTNAAVDEIKRKLGNCSKIFSYPNFIGTIQSFVDEFLARPFYQMKFKKRIYRIDNEIYAEMVDRYMGRNLKGFALQVGKNAKYFMMGFSCQYSFRLKDRNGDIILVKSINGDELQIVKPRQTRNYVDFTQAEKDGIKQWLIKFKITIMEEAGALHYDDAYFLAERYLNTFPKLKEVIQKRFSFVFVDEMQDMDNHQYDLLERLFYDEGASPAVIQRIGDKNQAIYSSTVKITDVWQDRAVIKRLSDSMRLSGPIANVVSNFALYRGEGFALNGLNLSTLKPHILVYNDETLEHVIPFFSSLVKTQKDGGHLTDFECYPIKVVAWNTEWKDVLPEELVGKVRLVDYHTSYSKEKAKSKNDYANLKSYLLYYDKNKATLESIRKGILNGILKVLRIENITQEGRPFTKRTLLDTLKSIQPERYEELKLHLYNWSIGVIRGNTNAMLAEVRVYLPSLCSIFTTEQMNASQFFIDDETQLPQNNEEINSARNIIVDDEMLIEVTSVHAVKGQTHCATLYLESYYHKDGNGANAKSYESQRLVEQFLGNPLEIGTARTRTKESAKIAFVGLSRPTNFLCVAIHKNRFDAGLEAIDREVWEVKEVPRPIVIAV